ncbi:kinase-like protein [Cubamyces sp. BRFM 1775]|nr:kinase-like protein [Cubamyces sp. BRFM 1775]
MRQPGVGGPRRAHFLSDSDIQDESSTKQLTSPPKSATVIRQQSSSASLIDSEHHGSDITCSRFPDLHSVKAMISQGKVLVKNSCGVSVVEVDRIIIKFGMRVCKSEAMAMRLVHSTTTVPLPYCHAYFSEPRRDGADRCGYLAMDKAPGTLLIDLLDRLDERSCDLISSQLHSHISSLRTLSRPGMWGMIGKGGIYHGGFFSYLHPPIDDEQMRRGNPCVASSTQGVLDYFARALLLSEIDTTRPSVFSHGDLVPENILVDEGTCTITSIIDWERAGWYPYFWDDALASFRKSAYQRKPNTCKLWDRIRMAAIADPSEDRAAGSFSGVLFWLAINGYDELPGVQ